VEASPGHVFTKEGEEITKFLIVETGSLVRTKASAGEGDAITLDEIGENGVTGFMHVAGRDSGVAFATITAGSEGAKVWVVGTEFDDLLRLVPMLKHTT
jgi:CRP-like cAMP-binding protein